MTKVTIEDVSFKYHGAEDWVLRGINLKIQKGELVAIMGPTGAGKSTLCLALNGIIPHIVTGTLKGSVTVDGIDTRTASVSELARKVGMTFQDLESQLFGLTVEEEIAFGPENLGMPRSEISERIENALDVVRMKEHRFRSPWELSGGQKQRVAIAAALAMRPEVLVMDEPTSELDPIGKGEIFSVMETLREQHGITIILVEHDAEKIAEYADRVLMIEDGRLREDEPPRSFFSKVLEQETRQIRCPQVSEMAQLLRKSGMWHSEIPITLTEGLAHLREVLGDREHSYHLDLPSVECKESRALPNVIEVRDLHYSYSRGTEALRGVTLDISRGEIVAIIGQNGSGKTTLVKHFNGLLKPTSGSVRVGGVGTRNLSVAQLSRTVGYAFQNPDHQIFCDSVEEELAYGPRTLGFGEDEVKKTVDETLTFMGLMRWRSEHPLFLGKGQRKLVAISSVLAMNPDVLILDEPTTGQDFTNILKISEAIKRIHGKGKTVVIVTHDMRAVASLAQRTVVLMQGKVLLDAPTRFAFGHPEELRQSFIEPPQVVALCNALKDKRFPTCLDVNEVFSVLDQAFLRPKPKPNR